MTVLFEQRWDSFGEGATVTLSAPFSNSGASATALTAAAHHGARGARYASTGTSGRQQYDFGSNQTGIRVNSFYFKINTFSTANQYLCNWYSLSSGGTSQGDVRINLTTNTIRIRNGTTATGSDSTGALSAGVWYRMEWLINTTTSTTEARVYEDETTNIVAQTSGTWTGTANRVMSIGPSAAAAGGAIDYDTWKGADNWVGAEVPPPPASTHYVRRSGVWVPQEVLLDW